MTSEKSREALSRVFAEMNERATREIEKDIKVAKRAQRAGIGLAVVGAALAIILIVK